jgi:hypothetical protein
MFSKPAHFLGSPRPVAWQWRGRKMARCLAVMQPTFLPWAGYFNLIAEVDDFVFLDDVQLERQSWQTRNRLIIGGEVRWVVVPVRNTSLTQTIMETQVLDGTHWREKFARGFAINYGRHPHRAEAEEIVHALVTCTATSLSELNESVIRVIAGRLELTTRLHRASQTGVEGVRSTRLAELCRHFDADEYLSPAGAASYLTEDRFVENARSSLRLQDYSPGRYTQRGSVDFHSHLSVLDVVANLGWQGTKSYVRNVASNS